MNGWVYALFGLQDLVLAGAPAAVGEARDKSLNALVTYLPKYDAGYWSYYDTAGTLASPYYHRAHIALLAALERMFPDRAAAFGAMRERFEHQFARCRNRARAVLVKAVQKLRKPPDVIVR